MNKIVLLDKYYIPLELIKDAIIPQFTYYFEDYDRTTTITTYNKIKEYIAVPSGSWHKIEHAVKNTEIDDKRTSKEIIDFPQFCGTLWENQRELVNKFMQNPNGFIHSRPGSGKTVMACKILAELKQKFLVIVPTTLLLHQWKERLETYLPGIKVAMLGDNVNDYDGSQHGVIAIINSIRTSTNITRFRNKFGVIIMDEAHRLPALTYKDTINNLSALYKIGLSANTTRKDQRHVMIEDFLGPYCVVNKDPTVWQAEVIILNTGFPFMFTPAHNWSRKLNEICGNLDYNKYIAFKILQDLAQNRKIAVLTPRLFQIEQLVELLPDIKIGIITGAVKQAERNELISKINAGEIDVLLCSKQIFEEGVDIKRLDTIHLVAPSNNIEKLEQAIGRVERVFSKKQQPLVYDYWFLSPTPNSFHKQQKIRLEFYKERGYGVTIK